MAPNRLFKVDPASDDASGVESRRACGQVACERLEPMAEAPGRQAAEFARRSVPPTEA